MNNLNKNKSASCFRVTAAVLLVLAMLLPAVFVGVTAFALPPVYDGTFVGELGEKYDRLCSIDTPKVVVVGGSSVAFGLESDTVKEELGMEVVNFGLYANLGTKIMMDLSRANVNEGDIIVLAPEMNAQTLSLYFNNETTMQALDGNLGMLANIDSENYAALLGAIWGFSGAKLGYLLSGNRPENVGAYSKDCFDEHGDNEYERPYNVMTTVPKTVTLDFRVVPHDGVTTEYERFIDYVNEYTAFCKGRGANVYFSFAPMNRASMTDYNTEENIYGFYENLCSYLDCKVISNVNDYILDEGYFFDSEFHLNDAGVTVRTARLIDDIKRARGITSETVRGEDLPKPPGYKPLDFASGDSENLYFELEEFLTGAGQTAWSIVGLNAEGMKQVSLQIPNNIEGIPVANIGAEAFSGADVRVIYVGENISSIESRAFAGAMQLGSVYIPKADPGAIGVPNSFTPSGLMTLDGADGLKFYVPSEALDNYKSDYFWDAYSDRLIGYDR